VSNYGAYLKQYRPDNRLRHPLKSLIVRSGLYFAPPTPNPPPGKATHERLDPQLDLEPAA
jgi:hypothetical protein